MSKQARRNSSGNSLDPPEAAAPAGDAYEFGPFRLDDERRLLTRDQVPIALPPKTYDLLLLMVRSPGRAFSKQELMTALWPDTFVEEANLSFQVSTLRKALGDGAARWIETMPRHGYRFSTDVRVTRQTAAASAGPLTAHAMPHDPPPHRSRQLRAFILGALLLATLVVTAAAYVIRSNRTASTPAAAATRDSAVRPESASSASSAEGIATPLTAYQGFETVPSLSPDGSQVAFAWNGPKQDNHDIYVKLVGPGEPVRLTAHAERDDKPAWSPDGRHIAFLRFVAESTAEIFIIPALGGAERRLGTIALSPWIVRSQPMGDLAWTRDGQWLAVGGQPSPREPDGIWLFEIDGVRRRSLTVSPDQRFGARGDVGPAFSHDGRRMAFVRATSSSRTALFVQDLSSDLSPAGPPVMLASDGRRGVLGLAWTPDDRAIIFSWGGHLGQSRLHRIALPGGPPVLLPFGEDATTITIGPTGRLVYASHVRDTTFRTLDLAKAGSVAVDAGLGGSTFDEHTPDYSPDGRRLVFASTRSGAEELWISQADGTDPRQLTFMRGPQCSNPQWSPDGRTILFNSRREGSADLYVLDPATGDLRRLTSDPQEELEARWSRDGRSIYFGSDRTGRYEIWKMPADGNGGGPMQITRHGGLAARESPDGRFLYYAKDPISPSAIWRMPIAGGEERLVADGLSYSVNFVVGQRGLCLVALGDTPQKTSIDLVDVGTGRRRTLASVDRRWWFGVALSPDERRLLFPTIENAGSNLMVVDRVP